MDVSEYCKMWKWRDKLNFQFQFQFSYYKIQITILWSQLIFCYIYPHTQYFFPSFSIFEIEMNLVTFECVDGEMPDVILCETEGDQAVQIVQCIMVYVIDLVPWNTDRIIENILWNMEYSFYCCWFPYLVLPLQNCKKINEYWISWTKLTFF